MSEKTPVLEVKDLGIDFGGLTAVKAVGRIRDDINRALKLQQNEKMLPGTTLKMQDTDSKKSNNRHAINGVIVEDIDSCMIKFAKCCTPVPGDSIVGFITKGFGVSVHRCDCPNAAARSDPRQAARWVHCQWATADNQPFNTTLELECINRDGLVMDVSTALFAAKIRLKDFKAAELPDGRSVISISFEVRNVTELTRIRNRLLSISNVVAARRGQN